jgi:serine/threonine protein kinase
MSNPDTLSGTLPAVLARLTARPAAAAADAARADQDRRWREGERPPVEAYLAGLPAVAADPDQAMVLIYGEVLARAACGELPTEEEYAGRFPHLAPRIAVQFAVHAAVHPGPRPRAGPSTPTLELGDAAVTQSGPPADACAIPVAIGPYRLLGELGRGGMGLVYAAHDPTLDREVAVKTLFPGQPTRPNSLDRFVREAFITAKLPHPGIPPVYALGEQRDRAPYLAMKLVRGHTLEHLLRNRPHPAADLPQFIAIYEQVCQAVGFAHSQRVVHRDLKPSNVMVGAFGEVQVMDWGLAKDLTGGAVESPAADAEASGLITPTTGEADTQPGSILGTPAYMAPEQARGEPADPRADVFALGGLLTVILTGQPTFIAPDARSTWRLAVAANTTDALARLSACRADPDLIALAARCLATNPADRPADAGQVATLVADHRAGVEERLRRSETEQAAAEAREAEGRRKRRWQRVAAGVVALLVAGGAAFAWWQDKTDRDRKAEVARVEGEKAANDAVLAGRNAEALEVLLREVERALGEGDADRAAVSLAQARKRVEDLGGGEFADRVGRCHRDLDMLRAVDAVDALYYERAQALSGRVADPELFDQALAVFRRYGLIPGVTTPDAAAQIIHRSLIRETLECAIARGFATVSSQKKIQYRLLTATLATYLHAIDPDDYRSEVRAAMVSAGGMESAAVNELLARPTADQPSHFVHMIVAAGSIPRGQRMATLREAFARRPSDFRLHFGMAYYTRGTDESLSWLRTAVALRPRNALVWAALGVELDRFADRERRRRQNLRSQAQRHKDPGRRAELSSQADAADAFHHQLLVEAEVAAGRSVALEPGCSVYHLRRGMILGELGRWEESLEEHLWAAALDPAGDLPRTHVGWAHDALRARPPAVAALTGGSAILAPPPTTADVRYRLGVRLRQVGSVGWAVQEQQAALVADPNDPRPVEELKLLTGLRALGMK